MRLASVAPAYCYVGQGWRSDTKTAYLKQPARHRAYLTLRTDHANSMVHRSFDIGALRLRGEPGSPESGAIKGRPVLKDPQDRQALLDRPA